MPSPLPGMNPWLEWHWGDVHTRFVTFASIQLQPKLPRDLRARVEERIAVETDELAAEPIVVLIPDEPVTERFIEIKEFRGGPVITVIELLSPINKQGGGKKLYETKRLQLVDAGISLVEIDLIRQGDRPWYVDAGWYADDEPYHVVVRPGWDIGEMSIYPISLRERLPTFRVPLRDSEEPVLLSLQPVIDQCHDTGGYGEDLDFAEPPPGPPLSPDDWKWIDELLTRDSAASSPSEIETSASPCKSDES
ncbi:MAG: DUF4058 family protein [Planctomycetaceae bacterium]